MKTRTNEYFPNWIDQGYYITVSNKSEAQIATIATTDAHIIQAIHIKFRHPGVSTSP